jgi:hypothetical protein
MTCKAGAKHELFFNKPTSEEALFYSLSIEAIFVGCHDIQHNDTQHNDTQHNETQHNDTQHNDTQHNDTQHKGLIYY